MLRSTLLLIGIIVTISILECFGQSCLLSFQKNPSKWVLFLGGVTFYSLVCLLLVLSYQFKGLGLINVLWSGISVLVIVSVGMIVFNEKITRMDWFGVALVLLGIALIMWEGDHDLEMKFA
jgi:multidrug transporter EmrE-like cation transporter